MIINTTDSTITFDKPITLGIEDLNALILLLEASQQAVWENELLASPSVICQILTPSESDYRVHYNVRIYSDGHLECSCPDFEHRGHTEEGKLIDGYECKHLRKLRA